MYHPRFSRGLMRSSNDPPRMAFLIGIAALSIGTLLSLTHAEEPKQIARSFIWLRLPAGRSLN